MSTALRGEETVVDAVVAKLRAYMPARVAAINAEKADDVTVPEPDPSDFYVGGVNLLPRTPAIVVTVGEALYGMEGAHSMVVDYEIVVFVVAEDRDRQNLTRKLWRLTRAVTEALWDDPPAEALEGSAFTIRPDREEPGPTERPETDDANWRAGRAIVFTASQSEN